MSEQPDTTQETVVTTEVPDAAPVTETPVIATADETLATPQPATYKLPEGIPTEVADFAKKHGLTQEQLDGSLNFFGSISQAHATAQQEALRNLGEAHIKNWGENASYNLKLAQRALKQTDTDGSLTKALNETGYGNHPAVLNFLFNLGKTMQEGGFLKSMTQQPGKKSWADKMYGNTES